MKTKSEISMEFGKGPIQYPITIPAGTRVVPCNDGSGEFFVDDLCWASGMVKHDATYYGIRLKPDQVE